MKKRIFYGVVRLQYVFAAVLALCILAFILLIGSQLLQYVRTLAYVSKGDADMLAPVPAPKLAIVIDDFGLARAGIEELFDLDAPITCAIMPRLQHSQADAVAAVEHNKEVIIHIPLQAQRVDNPNWVGPHVVKVDYGDDQIADLIESFVVDLPQAIGANIHMGTLGSTDTRVMTRIMDTLQSHDLYFMDSRTSGKSVCKTVAADVGIPFASNDIFLEQGGKSYDIIVKQLRKAAELAKKCGSAIAIGHVGAQGGSATVQGIRDMLPEFKEMGVELVFLSKLVKLVQ